MPGSQTDIQHRRLPNVVVVGRIAAAFAFVLAVFFDTPFELPCARGEPLESAQTQAIERTDGVHPSTSDPVQRDQPDATAGLCNLIDPCGDPDCSTATKCTAGCFGNPVCAPQCGGSACNVGCSLGVCGAGCSQECNLVTCPQNTCSTRCGDPNCKVVCGGSPCNGGCPDRCDPALCTANALCLSSCGGNSCNIGCSPCEAGCSEQCNPLVCPTNALCLPSCGGSPCNVGCDLGVCGSGCPQACDPVLCPQNVVDCAWSLLNTVSNQVNSAIARAEAATDRATQTRDDTGDMVGTMGDGLGHLTGEMRDRIQEAVQALQQAVLEELAGATDFINGPNSCSAECEAFRSDLITLLTSTQDISNALLSQVGISGQADVSSEIDFIGSLSGKALFPLYRVLQALPVLEEDFLASMGQLAGNLAEVAPYLGGAVVAGGGPVDTCRLLADNDELVEGLISAAKGIDKVGKGLKMAGSVLDGIGKSKIAARGGVWGFAGIRYSGGLLERLGGRLESLGKRLEPVATEVEDELHFCVLKINGEDAIDAVAANHEQFMTTDQAILDVLNAIQAAQADGADLNDDGAVDLDDYSLFYNTFGSTGPLAP